VQIFAYIFVASCALLLPPPNTPANAANNVFLSSNQQTKQHKQRGRKKGWGRGGSSGPVTNVFLIVVAARYGLMTFPSPTPTLCIPNSNFCLYHTNYPNTKSDFERKVEQESEKR